MKKYTAFIISILIAAYTNVYAQLNPVWNVQSPEVANLGTYGQIPVSHFTGVPNISIPVYNIKVGKYSFPLSISYHLASVKPQNQGGCLGLGWNLMAGGYITRTVRGGIYDEQCDANGKTHVDRLIANRYKLLSAQIYIYKYDSALRLTSITNPSGITEYYAYDN